MTTTLHRTLGAGEVVRVGSASVYRTLAARPGEGRMRRDELGVGGERSRASRSLLFFAQVTDLQLADVQSPGRYEFFEELRGQAGTGSFVPAQRPQEAFAAHTAEMLLRSLSTVGESRDTGAGLDLVLFTGDSIDNAQLNELEWFSRLLQGGELSVASGAGGYAGVQSATWPGPLYWHPDPGTTDWYKEAHGFPTVAGALEAATAPFSARGLPFPWVACFGNHEGLVLGEAIPTKAYLEIAVGSRKPIALAAGVPTVGHDAELFCEPERWLAGPARTVSPDGRRRPISRAEFVQALLAAPGSPAGHGFEPANASRGYAYGVVDVSPDVRLIILDTTNLDGHFDGSIGERQGRWLEEQLAAVHSRHFSPDGRVVRTANSDRLVVLASHHGPKSLTNLRQEPSGPEDDHPRLGVREVESLLHRFPNVVLWLSGHRHVNDVTLRAAAAGSPPAAFWDVATAALADWPCQARLVELVANPGHTLSILSTMLDHESPLVPHGVDSVEQLASLHRELAGNAPAVGFGGPFEGRRIDRNVELLLPAPFALA